MRWMYICSVYALQDYAMTRNRIFFAALALAGLVQTVAATPVVIVNQGQGDSCTITPTTGTVFTLSNTGDVLINGSYTAGSCSGSGGGTISGDPTFSPFSPAPANLTVIPSTLGSSGGSVTPAFVVYYANTCTGSVTATAGCPAVSGAWGTGGTVCNYTTNGQGQKYCTPSGSVTMPANSTQSSCVYTFKAINCTNGTTAVNSQTAAVTISATALQNCSTSDSSDIGYSRQCSGSATNYKGTVSWDNTYATLMNGAWPGNAAAVGHNWGVTLNATQYASFEITTGSVAAGVQFVTQNSTSPYSGLISISTSPGDFFGGTSICQPNSTISISSKPGTTAQCKLSLNSTYYMNISMASFFPPYSTTCTSSACTVTWGFQSYGS
jgi:hypothetical protein